MRDIPIPGGIKRGVMIRDVFRKFCFGRSDGSVAVEFAMLAIPFVYTTIAIIELSMFFAASNMLEAGVSESSRMIRTGQLQTQTALPAEQAFRQDLCSNLYVLIDCDDILLEVVSMPGDSFQNADDYQPRYDEDGNFDPRDFNAGGAEDVVLIRVYYRYHLMTPIFAQIFSREADQTIPIMSTVVIQSEPYQFEG